MQGELPAMIDYGIGILPIIKNLKRELPDLTQPWCADNAKEFGKFTSIKAYFNLLKQQGPGCGYDLEPSKSVLIVHMENIEA